MSNLSVALAGAGPGTPVPPPRAPNVEAIISQQAGDAIAKGAPVEQVNQRLKLIVDHLRANPDVAAQASDALAKGADPGAVSQRVYQHATASDPVASYLAKYGPPKALDEAPIAAESIATDPVAAYRQKYGTARTYSPDNPFAPTAAPAGIARYSPNNPFAPRPDGTASGGSEADVLAHGLSMGLSSKLGAGLSAAEDLVKNHSLAHAGEVYNAAVAANDQNYQAARTRSPGLSAAVEAAGSVVPIAASTLAGGVPESELVGGLGRAAATGRTSTGVLGRAQTTLLDMIGAPAGSTVEAAGPMARIAQTARVGAGTGAVLSGAASTGSLQQRLGQTARGALVGGALGAGGQIVGDLGAAGWRSLQAIATPMATRAAGAAEKQLATAFTNDGGIEAAMQRGASDDAIGAPSLIAHTGGRNVNNLVWKSVNTPSAGGTKLANALAPIKQGEGAVLSRGLGEVSGVGDATAFQRQTQIQRQQQISGHQLYGTALGNAPVADPDIAQAIAGNPRLLDAAQHSLSVLEGQGVATDADRKAVQGLAYLAQNRDAPEVVRAAIGSQPMSVQLLHTMKQGAGDLIQAGLAKDKTFTNLDAQNLNSAVDNILSRLDQHVPAYGQARMVWGNDARRLDAINAGAAALSRSPEEIAAQKAGLAPINDSPGRPRLLPQNEPDFTLGAVDALRNRIASKAPGSAATSTVFGPQIERDRLQAIIGPDGRAAYEPYFDYGQRVEATHNRAFGGSSTSGNENIKAEDATPDYGMGVRSVLSHRRALMAAASRFTTLQRKGFQGAVADQLGQRLAVPSGTSQAEAIFNRLGEVRDENSANALGQRAASLLRLRNALGVASGVAASR